METIALVVYWVSDHGQACGLSAGCKPAVMWAGHPVLNELVLSMFA